MEKEDFKVAKSVVEEKNKEKVEEIGSHGMLPSPWLWDVTGSFAP